MKMVPMARKTAHNLATIRYSTYIITLTLTLLLTACVPIPAIPPPTTAALPTPDSAAEPKASFSDLASALAKIDESDEIQLYSQILDEFAACMQAEAANEEEGLKFSESETVAMSIYFAGMFSMGQYFALAFEEAITENTDAGDETEDEPSAYEMLEMALTACLQSEPE